VVSHYAASIRRFPKGAGSAPSPPLEERVGERRHHARCCGLGDIPAGCGTNLSGMVTENDGLLSLSLSSRGGEGTGKARYLQAREGLGQHARQSAHFCSATRISADCRRRLLLVECGLRGPRSLDIPVDTSAYVVLDARSWEKRRFLWQKVECRGKAAGGSRQERNTLASPGCVAGRHRTRACRATCALTRGTFPTTTNSQPGSASPSWTATKAPTISSGERLRLTPTTGRSTAIAPRTPSLRLWTPGRRLHTLGGLPPRRTSYQVSPPPTTT